MSDWANVATLGKAKNLKGGLLAYPREGLPFLLEEGMEVVFVPPVLRAPRSGRIVSLQQQGSGAHLVYFDSIDSIDMAEKLQDRYCLVRRADLPEGFDRGRGDLVGFAVHDVSAGPLGTIVDLEENPAHPLLVVERGDPSPSPSPVRIPLVEEFIVSIDPDKKSLTMELPEGLLDL